MDFGEGLLIESLWQQSLLCILRSWFFRSIIFSITWLNYIYETCADVKFNIIRFVQSKLKEDPELIDIVLKELSYDTLINSTEDIKSKIIKWGNIYQRQRNYEKEHNPPYLEDPEELWAPNILINLDYFFRVFGEGEPTSDEQEITISPHWL